MPIRPRPFTFACGNCGWKKTVAPLSDALGPGIGAIDVRNVETKR